MERRYDQLYKSLYGVGATVACLLLLLSTLRLIPADAQTTPITDPTSERELESRVQTFFNTLIRGNLSLGVDELLRRSVFSSSGTNSQSIEQLRTEIERAKTEFGEIINWERYDTRQIGTDVFVICYILKHEQHPVMWKFTFYRKPSSTSSLPTSTPSTLTTLTTPNPWLLSGLRFSSDVDIP